MFPTHRTGNPPRLLLRRGHGRRPLATIASVPDGSDWFESQALDSPAGWSGAAVTNDGGFLVVSGSSTNSAATSTGKAFVVKIGALSDPPVRE